MPEVELCCRCHKALNAEQEEYVVVFRERAQTPRRIAHPECERETLAEKGKTVS
jgi:hypothetical protein